MSDENNTDTDAVPSSYKVDLLNKFSKAPAGFRLVEIQFKSTKARPVAPAAHCVAIPVVEITVQPPVLQQAMQAAFWGYQEAVIRDAIEDVLGVAGNKTARDLLISDEDISPAGIAAFMSAGPGKVSKDKLDNWFKQCLEQPLGLALAEKMGLDLGDNDADSNLLASWSAALEQHKELIISLSSPQARLQEVVSQQLLAAVQRANNSDSVAIGVATFLTNKLSGFITPKKKIVTSLAVSL